jgi:hypothetical protein
MIRRATKLATALIVAGVFSASGSAIALPTAQVTDPPLAPVDVGQVITFDASASVCDFPPCRYIWSWFYPSGITGGQMGEGPTIDFAFPSSAAGRTVAVVIKVVDNTLTHGFDSTTVRVAVNPLDPAAPPAADVPPAQAPPVVVVPDPQAAADAAAAQAAADAAAQAAADQAAADAAAQAAADQAAADAAAAAAAAAAADPGTVTATDPSAPPVDPVVTPPKPVRLRHGGHARHGT